jgi:hypothetical protein
MTIHIGLKYVPNPLDPSDVVPEECCPGCLGNLEYFSGVEWLPAYLYCPACNDIAFDPDTGEELGAII